jgi:glycine cleavage system H lipoate-binding protein
MEATSHVDVFATKGAEYLLVIGFLLVLALFWRLMNLRPRAAHSSLSSAEHAPALVDWFRLDSGCYYHQGHSWALPEDDQVVRVGIDDFAQRLLGQVESIDLPEIGSQLRQGEKGWKFNVLSKIVDVLSPVNGEVLAVNEEIARSPDLINDDPYERGWLLKVRVPRMKSDLKNLLSGGIASAWMAETVSTLRERMSDRLGLAMQDGGIPVSGFATALAPDRWHEVAAEFLMTSEFPRELQRR